MSDAWRDLGALFYIDLMAWKNRWRGIIAHPGRLAWQLAQTIIFLAVMIVPAAIGAHGRARPVLPVDGVVPIAGAGIFALLVLALVLNLGPAIKQYAPTCFTPADAHLLFTSRISARTIYLYALLRGFGRNLAATIIMLVPFAGVAAAVRLPLAWGRFGYSVGGLFAFMLSLQATGFLAFKLNKRFRLERVLSACLYGYLGAIIAAWGLLAISSRGTWTAFLTALNNPGLAWFPVVGWTKTLVLAPLVSSPALPWLLSGMVLLALVSLIAAVLLAADYYEEAARSIDEVRRLTRSVQEGQISLAIGPVRHRNVTLGWEGHGAAVFLWKELLVARRRMNRGLIALKYVAFTGLGAVWTYLLRNEPVGDLVYVYLMVGFFIGPLLGIAPAGLAYEIRHHYLYLLPGRVRDKILSVNAWLLCRYVLRNIALVLPTLFIGPATPLESLGLALALTVLDAERVFDRVLLRILLPWQRATSPLLQYIESAVQLLFLAPGLIVAGLAHLTLHNWAITLVAFTAGGFLAAYALLILSERYFARLELTQ